MDFIGIALLVAAGALVFWHRRRIFNRTNEYGVERFPSFGAKIRARIGDGMARSFALIFAASGVIVLAFEHQDTWGAIVLLPVAGLALAVALFLFI